MKYLLNKPMEIGSRLAPAIRIGSASWITLTVEGFIIDMPDDSECWVDGYRPGPMSSIPEMFKDLIAFLLAATDAMRICHEEEVALDEITNGDLFPENVTVWAYDLKSELEFAQFELEMNPNCCELQPEEIEDD